jgi:hypothetical protein
MSSVVPRIVLLAMALAVCTPLSATSPAYPSVPLTPDYASDAAWAVSPGQPGGADAVPAGASPRAKWPMAYVFYLHPTTFRGDAGR